MPSGLFIKVFHHLGVRYIRMQWLVFCTTLFDCLGRFCFNSCVFFRKGQAEDGKQPWQGVCLALLYIITFEFYPCCYVSCDDMIMFINRDFGYVMHYWWQVRERCKLEWQMFRNRLANAEKDYYKSMSINASNTRLN